MKLFSLSLMVRLVVAISMSSLVVRAQTSGTIDTTFGTNGKAWFTLPSYSLEARDLAVAGDGSVYVAGTAQSFGALEFRPIVVKFSADGVLDTSFGTGGYRLLPQMIDYHGRCIRILADGSLRIAGHTQNLFMITALTASGAVDPSYGSGGVASVDIGVRPELRAMALQSDGSFVMVGHADKIDTAGVASTRTSAIVARVTSTGVLDATFGTNGVVAITAATGSLSASSVEVSSDGKIVIGGDTGTTAPLKAVVARLLGTNGSLDFAFASGSYWSSSMIGSVTDILLDADGGVTALAKQPSTAGLGFAKLTSAGVPDTSIRGGVWTMGTQDTPAGIVRRASDRRMFVNSVTNNAGVLNFVIVRVQPDGNADTSFNGTSPFIETSMGSNVGDAVARLEMLSDGRLLSLGHTKVNTTNASTMSFALVRYTPGSVQNTLAAPYILTQPLSQTVADGSAASFTVAAAGAPSFVWRHGSSILTGQTSETLTFAAVTSADAGDYTVTLTNSYGSVTSNTVTLTLTGTAPSITTPPANLTVPVSTAADFSVIATGQRLSYVWKKNGDIIPGKTTSSLSFSSAKLADEGSYTVEVSSPYGPTAVSDPVVLTVTAPPFISDNTFLADTAVILGTTPTSLKMQVKGRLPMSYEWRKGASVVASGSITSGSGDPPEAPVAIDLPAVAGSAGDYVCQVTNADGTIVTSTIHVSAYAEGTVQMLSGDDVILSEGGSLKLNPVVWSAWVFYSEWTKDNRKLPDFSRTLERKPVRIADAGTYVVRTGTGKGIVTSKPVRVVVVESAPRTVVVAAGKTATITALAGGVGMTYRWRKGDQFLVNGGRISGAQKQSLVITSTNGLTDADDYVCEVKSLWGATLDTGAITLAIEAVKPTVDPITFDDARVLKPFSATITATNHTTKFTITGLPSGLTYNATTGEIDGVPLSPGTFSVKITATNPVGSSPVLTVPLVVRPIGVQGTHAGLVSGDIFGNATKTTIGTFSLTVAANGSYTGVATVSNLSGASPVRFTITGSFHEDLNASDPDTFVSVSNPINVSSSAFTDGPYRVTMSQSGTQDISATLLSASDVAYPITSFRNVWGSSNPATPYAGVYNALLRNGGAGVGNGGEGYASFNVSTNGIITMSGKLTDNTSIAMSSHLDSMGNSWVFQWLAGYKGKIDSTYTLADGTGPLYTDTKISGDMYWTLPPSSSVPAHSNALLPYLDGFDDLRLSIVGSRYIQPGKPGSNSSLLMDLDLVPDNLSLSIDGGPLDFDFDTYAVLDTPMIGTGVATLNANNTLKLPPFDSGNLVDPIPPDTVQFKSWTFNTSTGAFSGSCTAWQQVTITDEFGDPVGYKNLSVPLTFSGLVVRTNPVMQEFTGGGFHLYSVPVGLYDGDGNYLKTIKATVSGGAYCWPASAL